MQFSLHRETHGATRASLKITSKNLYLEIDCPDLALARHMNFKDIDEKKLFTSR